jgi:hypothetical protein
LLYYLNCLLARTRIKPAWLLSIIIAIQAVTIAVGLESDIWEPGYRINGPQSDWRAVQEWAKAATPQDAMFITPPQIFWHYIPDWRVFSERGTIFTTPEMMEIPFAPSFMPSIEERLAAIAPGALEQLNGDYLKTLEITGAAFYTNSREDFIRLACDYQADYLVVESTHPYDFDLAYQNDGFLVYRLPGCL